MLILTRKYGEAIKIDKDVFIYFLGYGKGQARIGIEAPTRKSIVRTELIDANGNIKKKEVTYEKIVPEVNGNVLFGK